MLAQISFFDKVADINGAINGFVWGIPCLTLLIATGVLMTVLTKGFQFSHFAYWFKNTIGSIFHKKVSGHVQDKGSISQFQALCTALAATVGVGRPRRDLLDVGSRHLRQHDQLF